MKQLLLILVLLVGLYSGWQVLKPDDRTKVKGFAKRHGVRFLIAVLVLFLLFVAAVQNPTFQLF